MTMPVNCARAGLASSGASWAWMPAVVGALSLGGLRDDLRRRLDHRRVDDRDRRRRIRRGRCRRAARGDQIRPAATAATTSTDTTTIATRRDVRDTTTAATPSRMPPPRPGPARRSTAEPTTNGTLCEPVDRSRLESDQARAGPPISADSRRARVPALAGPLEPQHWLAGAHAKGGSCGVRRHHRDPQGQPEQVRGGSSHRADPARPDAVHRDPVPRGLRLHRRHPRPGRRSAGRAGAAGRADVPRLPGHRAGDRHVPDDGRGRPRRQGAVRVGERPAAGAPAGHRTTRTSSRSWRSSTSSRSTRTWSPARASRAPNWVGREDAEIEIGISYDREKKRLAAEAGRSPAADGHTHARATPWRRRARAGRRRTADPAAAPVADDPASGPAGCRRRRRSSRTRRMTRPATSDRRAAPRAAAGGRRAGRPGCRSGRRARACSAVRTRRRRTPARARRRRRR